MLADLPPVGAGLERLLHGPLLRHARRQRLDHVRDHLGLQLGPDLGALVRLGRAPRIGARPAVDVGLVDDPAQAARAPDHGVARGAERLGDLGCGPRRRDARSGLGLNPARRRSTPPTSYTLIGTALLVPA